MKILWFYKWVYGTLGKHFMRIQKGYSLELSLVGYFSYQLHDVLKKCTLKYFFFNWLEYMGEEETKLEG